MSVIEHVLNSPLHAWTKSDVCKPDLSSVYFVLFDQAPSLGQVLITSPVPRVPFAWLAARPGDWVEWTRLDHAETQVVRADVWQHFFGWE